MSIFTDDPAEAFPSVDGEVFDPVGFKGLGSDS